VSQLSTDILNNSNCTHVYTWCAIISFKLGIPCLEFDSMKPWLPSTYDAPANVLHPNLPTSFMTRLPRVMVKFIWCVQVAPVIMITNWTLGAYCFCKLHVHVVSLRCYRIWEEITMTSWGRRPSLTNSWAWNPNYYFPRKLTTTIRSRPKTCWCGS
jgi:hypothetical protein